MVDLNQFNKRTSGQWRVRKKLDDSGDYTIATYDIMAHYEWGDKGICYDIENPHDALLFSSGPELLEEIERLRFAVYDLTKKINDIEAITKGDDDKDEGPTYPKEMSQ